MQFDLGLFVLDLTGIVQFFTQPAGIIVIELIAIVGWAVISYMLIYLGLYYLADEYKEGKYTKDWRWVVLAVDIPALNVQTPKAVEQMFSHLAGALDPPDIAGKYRHGFKQRWFSFEIISIEGYIQFLIRTEAAMQDLVEAAIYAQYPEADVTEVEDYVTAVPDVYPNETHDIWAADFGLAEDDAYPIRSYREFEHSISKDTVLKDPMGTFLESFSRIGTGEQMWFQIIVKPITNSWKEKAIKKVKELIGEVSGSSGSSGVLATLDHASNIAKGVMEDLDYQFTGRDYEPGSAASGGESGEKNNLKFMTPGQIKLVEAIEEKISKIGFKTKIRGMYIARKESFQPTRGVHALIGAINQFNIPSANSIVPKFGVSASYFFKQRRIAYRKKLLMKAYKKRKIVTGGPPAVLNIEELATIWHFPMSHVATPLIQKAQDKAVEPPAGLPLDSLAEGSLPPGLRAEEGTGTSPAPQQSRYGTDAGPNFDPGQRFG